MKLNRPRHTERLLAALGVAAVVAATACQPIVNPTPPVPRRTAVVPASGAEVNSAQKAESRRPVPHVRTPPRTPVPYSPAMSEIPGAIDVGAGGEDTGRFGAAAEPGESVLLPTYGWVNLVSTDSRLDGAPVPAGTVVTAYDPGGMLIGRTVVEGEGSFGPMALYMDDPATIVDEGAEPGDAIRFRINGLDARSLGPDAPMWSFNGALLRLDLAAGAE